MPRVKTYLKNGQIIETVCNTTKTTATNGVLTSAEWKNITAGERVLHANLEDISAITEVIEPEPTK